MGPVSTWYQVTPSGLEQGFTVYRPLGSAGGDLVIDLGRAAGWALAPNGSALVQKGPDGISLVYGDLKVTDAKGAPLRSQLAVVHGTAQIVAHPSRATVYPIYVDPTWSSSSSPTATLANPGGAGRGGQFGYGVALSADGTTALVGDRAGDSGMGAAYVFHVSSEGSWATSSSSPAATLTNAGDGFLDFFGNSVALSADGTTALIGNYGGANSLPGAAYVFHVPSEGSWSSSSTPTATLTDPNGATGDASSTSVALSADGTTAFIGANAILSLEGVVYVFHVPSEGSWANSSTPAAILTAPTGRNGDFFGTSVALSADGTTALIVASGLGSAYVFQVPSEGSWANSSAPTATLTSAASATAVLGSAALSADGTTALIGAANANGVSSDTGAAYVFHVPSEGSWATSSTPTATLTNAAGASGDAFGCSVALSADGTTALIGAYVVGSQTGAAYVFQVSGEGSWANSSAPTATLTNSAGVPGDDFGISSVLSADGTTALIGAWEVSSDTGAAYVLHVLVNATQPATFAGSYRFTYRYYDNGRQVSAGKETIGFGTDGHWTMSACTDTGTYSYNRLTDTVAFTDTTDPAHGMPSYTWVGLPSTGFTGLMASTAGGIFADERGTAVATPSAPSSCSAQLGRAPGSPGGPSFSSSPTATFAGSYRFSYRYYDNGRQVSAGNEAIGFGTDGHWTTAACTDTGTYRYDRLTDTVTLTDTTDPAHGMPSYTWVGLPSTGFTGLMRPNASGSSTDERGTSVATPSAPSGCSAPAPPPGGSPKLALYPAGVGPSAGNGAQPQEIAVGPDGNLWYTDEASGVFKFSPQGVEPLACSPASPTVGCEVSANAVAPNDIVAGPDGAMWFTQAAGGNPKGGQSYFPASIGRLTTTGSYSSYPVPASASSVPGLDAITVGRNGNLWFTETAVGRIGEITPKAAGPVVREFALPAADRLAPGVGSPVTSADTIAPGPGGDIWFTEQGSNAIGVMSTSGALLHKFTVPDPGSDPAPLGITEGPDQAMWFTENGANQVASITAQGKVTLYALPAAADGPESIVYGPDGNLWFTDDTGAARIDPGTGKVTLYRAHSALLGPAGVTVGPDCTSVWFTEPGAGRLGRVSPVPNTTGCKAGAVPVP
jgi:virginiamycin B lyase